MGPSIENSLWQRFKDQNVQMLGLDLYNGSTGQVALYKNTTRITFPLLMSALPGIGGPNPSVQTDYGHVVRLEDLMVVDQTGHIQLVGPSYNSIPAVIQKVNLLLANPPVQYTLSLTNLNFGPFTRVGATNTLTLKLENIGGADIEITGFQSSISGLTLSYDKTTVAKGETQDLVFTLSPTHEGELSGTVEILTSYEPISLTLRSINVGPALPGEIALKENDLTLGQVEVGQIIQRTITIQNEGQGNLEITDIQSETATIAFQDPITLSPNSETTLPVTIIPSQEGTISGVIEILSSDPDQSSISITLSGTAVITPADPRADFDADGQIAFPDFLAFVQAFGTTNQTFDINDNGTVDFGDFLIFAKSFGKSVE